jgi:hypothetical protein
MTWWTWTIATAAVLAIACLLLLAWRRDLADAEARERKLARRLSAQTLQED